jgi:hypothetical protein
MNTTILAGLSIIMAIRTIGLGAGINGANIGDTNTGSTNTIGTGGMMMTNSHFPGLSASYPESRHSLYCSRRFLLPSSTEMLGVRWLTADLAPLNAGN